MGAPKAIWNPVRDVWETVSIDLFSELPDVFSGIWPVSGMTQGGRVFELPMLGRRTGGSGCSLLHTPKAGDADFGLPRTSGRPPEKSTHLATRMHYTLPTPQAHDAQRGKTAEQVAAMRARGHGVRNLNEVAENELSLLKTPTSQLAVNGGSQHPEKRRAGGHGPTLADEVEHLLPTPAAMNPNDGESVESREARRIRTKERVGNGNGFGTPLAIAVQLLPTPKAGDADFALPRTSGRPPEKSTHLATRLHYTLPTGGSTSLQSNDGNELSGA